MSIPDLKDMRSPGMKDKPFSAYCKVCWQPEYAFCFGEHYQICEEPKGEDGICTNARNKMNNAIMMKKVMEEDQHK